MFISIKSYGSRFIVECDDNPRLHVLNHKSMTWHLKHVLKLDRQQIGAVWISINTHGVAVIELTQVSAA